MAKHKFEIGQRVIYEGLIAVIESKDTYYADGRPCYGLVAEEDEELTCTADEEKCELYIDQEIDQNEALFMANLESKRIQNMVGGLTDKYFRDGCH